MHRLAIISRFPCLLAILALMSGLLATTAAAQSCDPSSGRAQVTIQAGSPPTYYVFALSGADSTPYIVLTYKDAYTDQPWATVAGLKQPNFGSATLLLDVSGLPLGWN